MILIYMGSLERIGVDEPILSDMQGVTIFSKCSFRPCKSILITYLESSRSLESNEYDVIDMR
jgi:hypothetical protein